MAVYHLSSSVLADRLDLAQQVLGNLAQPSLWPTLRKMLMAPPALPGRSTGRAITAYASLEILRRLESIEGELLTVYGAATWAWLLWHVLPEAYADNGPPRQRLTSMPKTHRRALDLAARVERREQLHRPDDLQVPDHLALVAPQARNGHLATAAINDGEFVEATVAVLQGEGRNGPEGGVPRRRARGKGCAVVGG